MSHKQQPLLLALLGSPQKNGTNAKLLKAFLKPITNYQIKYLTINELNLAPCTGCNQCKVTKKCNQSDDMSKLLNLFQRADIFVLAAPVYFYTLPAQTKIVVDRSHILWQPKLPSLTKPGIFFSTCAVNKTAEFKLIVKEVKAFFNTIGFKYTEEILLPGMNSENSSSIIQHASLLAKKLGEKINQVLV